MSQERLTDQIRKALENPQEPSFFESVQSRKIDLERSFISGSIGLTAFRERLGSIEDLAQISLPYPGPLYGFLRKMGFDQVVARNITHEERDHYEAARLEGLRGRIYVYITSDDKGDYPREGKLHCFFAVEIPEQISDEDLRRKLKRIALAPREPSYTDLAMVS